MFRAALIVGVLLIASPVIARSEPAGARVEVNGMQMYYETSGEGAPLIVLHGAYMNIPTMGEIIPLLARSRKVIAVEMQGHGRTTDIDRPITYPKLADDIAAFMDVIDVEKADVFGYSMGAAVGLQLAIRYPEKVDRAALVSIAYDFQGWHPDYRAFVPQIVPELFVGTPMEDAYRELAADPNGFPALVDKLIALEHQPMAWEADVARLKTPILIIQGDADIVDHGHTLAMFRLLGGGVMGDQGKPLPQSRLAILPATSHTAIMGQAELLGALVEPFLNGEAPKGWFEPQAK
jgi:pimeloyl-ACP methyl ester carboxylesterase